MNISKEEYLHYTKQQLPESRQREIASYFAVNPLEEKAMKGLIDADEPKAIEDLLKRMETSIDKKIPVAPKQGKPRWKSLMFFALALIIVSSLYIILSKDSPTTQIEYASYFEPYPDVLSSTLRGSNDETISNVGKAMEAYNNGDYTSSSLLLAKAISSDSVDKRLPFYLGISLMGQKDYAEAYSIFQSLSEEPSYPYMDGVIWNKALAALALEKQEEAKSLLSQVVSENVYMRSEASELLNLISGG